MKVYKTVKDYVNHREAEGDDSEIYTTCGGFDPLHIGHLRCILETAEMAKTDNAKAVIVVNGDGFLTRKKGRPFMKEGERAEIISGLRGVDAVVIWDDGTQNCIGAIELLRPSLFTKGGDRAAPEDIAEWDVCNRIGCRVQFNVGGGKIQSSSWLTGQKNEENK